VDQPVHSYLLFIIAKGRKEGTIYHNQNHYDYNHRRNHDCNHDCNHNYHFVANIKYLYERKKKFIIFPSQLLALCSFLQLNFVKETNKCH
jgi:hypothetical protein